MSLLGKLLRKPAETQTMTSVPACSHRILIARWDNIEDMGHDDRATGYKCETCDEVFTAEAGHQLMNMA